ncbi:HAMP domain-containing histidine kinase [Clostridium sp. SYSU_GA19001]|uniref:sensor histidine kinase n=1 Tax=Clostridium caldaquaticum TaxID=2940653 RepID=UPI0020776901|nr:HAMP domain-containing sensor histidine kinase [Clostridium caldaquaticum]MCM8710100.1 HAMP domain-containing histidine kinase [Clostridium caldaquaticum]
MFKQLRNKFLILNLSIISIMMIIAFFSIYLITHNNVNKNIDIELRKILEFNKKPNDGPRDMKLGFDKKDTPPDRSLSFTLTIDSKGNILDSSSAFTMEDTFYEAAKQEALSENTDKGKFKLDGYYWAFIKMHHMDGYKLVFLDITSQQGILTNLIYTFLAVALAMLIVIFFISRFFANKSIEPIKEAFDKQKQFIGDASHELKTPLAVINTNVDVLLSNGEESIDSQAKWLHYIKSEVERMTKLTNDLLYLTQMDYSDMKMIFSEFNLSETIEDVILTMEAVIFENDISLDYDIEPNLTIQGNNEQIKQVVMILLDNALKYTNLKGKVNITLKKSHNNVLLSVTNTGKGIPEEHLSKIFDRFYRVDKSRSRNSGGYGLGLAIAKAIIEQHGGKISASSILNKSTTFTVELPFVK